MTSRPSPFQLVGGDPALDLVNTVSWRGDSARRIERIPDFGSLVHWSARAGLVPAPAARRLARGAADDQLAADTSAETVRGLREDLYLVIDAHIDGGAPPAACLRRIRTRFVEALRRASIDSLPLTWEVSLASPDALVDLLALRAVRLLQSDAVDRIGRCSNGACGWVFLDRSRNRSRRWCSSTDCGNRDRAARHYARRRSTTSGPPSS
jgi:predicted RNA-binding Zn ribbon-like protein